jgi:hypothetical protein
MERAAKPLEGTRDANVRVDFNEDAFGCVDVHLQEAGFVERRVQKSKKTLKR